MKRLLTRRNLQRLGQLARSNVLLGFDFDGTLAPIVPERDHASMRAGTMQLFRRVCELYPCAVISGRSRADVGPRLGEAAVKYLVGNHGLEPGRDLAEFAGEIAAVRPALERALTGVRGVELEDKAYSLAVHYRKARHKRAVRAVIDDAVSGLPLPMRTVPGKWVVNVVPASAAHKGDALLDLRRSEAAASAFFVGDDVTDEDVFALAGDDGIDVFTVRVGRSTKSAAEYFLRGQHEIDSLLAELIALRDGGPT
jgi:trehalose 6-phosphate phosphatase